MPQDVHVDSLTLGDEFMVHNALIVKNDVQAPGLPVTRITNWTLLVKSAEKCSNAEAQKQNWMFAFCLRLRCVMKWQSAQCAWSEGSVVNSSYWAEWMKESQYNLKDDHDFKTAVMFFAFQSFQPFSHKTKLHLFSKFTEEALQQLRLQLGFICPRWTDEQLDSGTLFVYILLPFLFLFFLSFTCLFVLFDPLSSQGSIKFHLILGTQRHTSSGRQPFIFHPSTHKPCFSLCNVETGHFL